MNEGTPATSSEAGYVDWGAIFAGAVVAAGVSLVFTTFASALGLGSVSVGKDGGISTFGLIITALFVAISIVAVYMLGGYVAGRMRRGVADATRDETTARDGLHGLVVWGLGMLVAGSFAASLIGGTARTVGSAAQTAVQATGSAAGGLAQGAGQLLGGAVSGVGQAVGGAASAAPSLKDMLPAGAQGNPVDYLVDQMARPNGQNPGQPQDPAAAQKQIATILTNVVSTGNISDSDRVFLRDQVVARTGLSAEEADARVKEAVDKSQAIRAEAQKKVDDAKAEAERLKVEAQKRFDDAKAQAEEAAEKARVASILTAFLLAASALIAAAAAFIGAVWGGRHRNEGRIWRGLTYHR
ncbi:hypothetical protein ACFQI3_01315 [Hansschlegelia quercus]|uniref:PhnA-like protein n=1 Tax=Hansschlegelia quercus TaxID=2528245 RepID=A0A4Q9G8P8_9HYPH|nr:hypothetical protein [Hansschlegelia quercus]TBN47018.1 hypothetical protein EYR15_16555 [Hansschlegelia quercus]